MAKLNTDALRAFIILAITSGIPALVALGFIHWDGQTLGIVDATASALVTSFFKVFKANNTP